MIVDAGPTYCAVQVAKDGPQCPVKVWHGQPADPETGEPLDRSLRWQVVLSGAEVDPMTVLIETYSQPVSAVLKGHAITKEDYDHMLEVHTWAVQHSPQSPEANPRKAIDLMTAPLPF